MELETLQWSASGKIPATGARKIFTSKIEVSGSSSTWSAIPFAWGNLSDTQKRALGDDPLGSNTARAQSVLSYLRGDQSNEGTAPTTFRTRTSRLGDIVHAGAVFAGVRDLGYGAAMGLSTAERSAYNLRKSNSTYKNRTKMVYVGANDGMLHGFDASTGATGGVEQFAYIPNAMFNKLETLSRQDYAHSYFVDGPIRISDAYINSSWKTLLVASTGAGGKAYFALNVENPTTFNESNVLWEFTHPELGAAIGQASIVRTENGKWVAIFGNGYNSTSNTARLFVVDLATGQLLRMIDTGVGSASTPNGLGTPAAVDVNGNGAVDTVYAGDMLGNMWKFDFSGTDAASVDHWRVAFSNGSAPRPLFTARNAAGDVQPITSEPAVRLHPSRSGTIVYFGTGQFFEVGDQANKDRQSIYGVFDECGNPFNLPAGCTANVSGESKIRRSELVQQQFILQQLNAGFSNGTTTVNHDIRVLSANSTSAATQKGFYIDLVPPSGSPEGERLISSPSLAFSDRVIFSSFIPEADPCGTGGSGWLYELDPFTGGRTNFSVFDLNEDGRFDSLENATVGTESRPVNGTKINGGAGVTPGVLFGDPSDPNAKTVKTFPSAGGGVETVVNKPEKDFGRQAWQSIR